jgi:two-component system OmpR family sensor kinase
MMDRNRGSLVWKLYMIGFTQLVLLGIAVAGAGVLLRPMRVMPRPPSVIAPPPEGSGELPVERTFGPSPVPGPPNPVWPLLVFLVNGLVIVGIGSFLTARWIVRPLETLSRTARALGQGDLKARAGLKRHDELGALGHSFDEMAERVQKLLLAERELLANVSHELRTPLARIRVALDIASDANADAQSLSLAEINTDLAEIEALIDDILTTARLQIGDGPSRRSGFVLHLEEVAPSVLCQSASDRFRARHPRRMLDMWVDEDLPLVSADPKLLRRAIDNLLDNADKYSPDLDSPVTLRGRASPAGVHFEVADQGMGIPPEDLPHIYSPFFRSERSRSRGTGGVGLGLTLARGIIEAHGGSIDLRSAVGIGTTVRVALPPARTR